MENEKIKLVDEAEINLNQLYPENPELSQVYVMRGIGYAILALVELLKNPKIVVPPPKSMSIDEKTIEHARKLQGV